MTTQRSIRLSSGGPGTNFRDVRRFERTLPAAFSPRHPVGPKTGGVVVPTPQALRVFARTIAVACCCFLGVGVHPRTFFGVHVFDVVQRFPHEQMGGVAASTIVAGVTNVPARGHLHSCDLSSKPVRAVEFAVNVEDPIPFSIQAPVPIPAPFCFGDSSPKSGLDFFCDQWKSIGIHG